MRAADAEIHDIDQRRFPFRRREQRQRIEGHRAVMPGAVDRVFEGAVLVHQRDRMIEIVVA